MPADLTAVGTCPSGVSLRLSITSENPVYIQGDFNANLVATGWSAVFIPTSVAGDAVTLLSNRLERRQLLLSPYALTAPQRQHHVVSRGHHRRQVALPFPQPSGTGQDYGTDGGVHNFLRYIEAWTGTLNIRAPSSNLYFSRQANSTFKCCTTVYSPPTRGYKFDINFLNPTLLPPRTPLFRDVNTTGWTRLLLPGQYQ